MEKALLLLLWAGAATAAGEDDEAVTEHADCGGSFSVEERCGGAGVLTAADAAKLSACDGEAWGEGEARGDGDA